MQTNEQHCHLPSIPIFTVTILPPKCTIGHSDLITGETRQVKEMLVDSHPLRYILHRLPKLLPLLCMYVRKRGIGGQSALIWNKEIPVHELVALHEGTGIEVGHILHPHLLKKI